MKMNGDRSIARSHAFVTGLMLSIVASATRAAAQSPLARIPVVVAQALTFEPGFFGVPQFFDGRTPPGWPNELMPPGAKVVGGGTVGDSAVFQIKATVFEFAGQSDPRVAFDALMTGAGYARSTASSPTQSSGGFMPTPEYRLPARYCRGSSFVSVALVDSVHAPSDFAVMILDGDAGRENCAPRPTAGPLSFPVTIPSLSAPAGVASFGGGRGWSGANGQMTTTLRTTMPTDSLVAHYAAQLAAAGWKAEGRPANVDGVGIQRFSFREGRDPWIAVLIIIASGERRELMLQVTKRE